LRKDAFKWLTLLALVFSCSAASAAITCTIGATGVNGVYNRAANLNLPGTLSVNCARLTTDPNTQTVYIGLSGGEGSATRDMTRQNAAQLLRYEIYRNPAYTGTWNTGTGRTSGTNSGGLIFTINFGGGTSVSQTVNYYLRVNSGITRPAGIYDDLAIVATLRKTNDAGALMSTATFGVTASIVDQCFFNSVPASVVLSYPSFSQTVVSTNTSFTVSCTQSTSYTMSLNPKPAPVASIGLTYSLTLSSASAVGTGFVQTHSIAVSIPAGQQGKCNTGTCTATDNRVITLSY
jgi:spore coat protein U-like protein